MREKPVKTPIRSYTLITAAHKKILLGVQIEKIRLSEEHKVKLIQYMQLCSPGKSAYQIAEVSNRTLSGTLCAELSRIRKIHRKRALE